MKPTLRNISFTYSTPFVDPDGTLCISWCGEILRVIGISETAWVCLNF